MKILNLYAGLGGNRFLWRGHHITAVESNKDIAAAYSKLYPSDKIIVGDAHKYLEDNFSHYDFIWASTPCQSHSKLNYSLKVKRIPDMKLYGEVIFLKTFFKGGWVVENVAPYYKPLLPAYSISRHLFWSNFTISDFSISFPGLGRHNIPDGERIAHKLKWLGMNIPKVPGCRYRQLVDNCVHPKIGLHVLNEFLWRGVNR